MDIVKIGQRFDFSLGVICLIAAGVLFYRDSPTWASTMLLSSIISFIFAKYSPGRYLLKRMLLARMK